MSDNPYAAIKQRLAAGWNTFNTRSVLSHVHLPSALAVNLGIKERAHNGQHLREALIGRMEPGAEKVQPGPRSYDGSYTELVVAWQGIRVLVRTATDGDDWVALVEPLEMHDRPALLVVELSILWNRPGHVERRGDTLAGFTPAQLATVFVTGELAEDPYTAATGPYMCLPLDRPVVVSTGRRRMVGEVDALLASRKEALLASRAARWGNATEIHAAVQTAMAWDTIYEPAADRVITPVSRIWNVERGGWVVFCWDNYFAALLAGVDNKDLAYANIIEITREKTEGGFVPNNSAATGRKSWDRSQPPVGAMCLLELFRKFGDRWIVELLFDDLLVWNRWWAARRDHEGLLCWGSDPFTPRGILRGLEQMNCLLGAALESGLDDSPMYDDMPFDSSTHLMQLWDVGLNGLYVYDCECLAELADGLGRSGDAAELRTRAANYRNAIQRLWDQSTGMFLNRRTDTGEFSHRLAPTLFYALLAGAANQDQARRIINEHFFNEAEFWGQWVLPAIARNDPAYGEQTYWRGRIWAPLNFLTFLSLRRYPQLKAARKSLVDRSAALLLKEWREHGHVHENYNAITGEGCDSPRSDRFYHWGALLGLMSLMENGQA